MSKRSPDVAAEECTALGAEHQRFESYPNRTTELGSLTIARALPIKERRMVGPWCFLDRFGPLSFTDAKPMDVAPHPHIGLQTVTWLLDGEVAHDDSLGSQSLLRPRGVNVMTSGAGIAHAEQTPRDHTGRLNGVQLWTALPEAHRHATAVFEALAEVPLVEQQGGVVQVFAGAVGDAVSAARYYSPLVGADLTVHPGETLEIPLEASFEHALLLLSGDAAIEGHRLEPHTLHYLGCSRTVASFSSEAGARVLLVGGPPFPETILMWWNFVARSADEIAQAREDWMAHRRFGEVTAYQGPRLDAPSLVRPARANPLS